MSQYVKNNLEYRLADRQWTLIERINRLCADEGWILMVCGDGMVVIDTDEDAPNAKGNAFSYVEGRADGGSLVHQVAHGLHGMIMTEDA